MATSAGAPAQSDELSNYPPCSFTNTDFDISNGLANSGFDTSRLVAPDRARVVFDKQLNDHAIETNWQVGDRINFGYRTELADQCLMEEGVPIYYRLSFKIPEDMKLDESKSVLIGQFHTPDPNHKPQIALRYRGNGHFDITFNFRATVLPTLTPDVLQKKPIRILDLPRGQWHKIEMLVVWSSETDGRTDVVFNGKHVLRYEGPTNFASQRGRGPYFKFGIYPWNSNSSSLTMLHARYDRIKSPPAKFLEDRNFYSEPERLEKVLHAIGDERRELTVEPEDCVAASCQ